MSAVSDQDLQLLLGGFEGMLRRKACRRLGFHQRNIGPLEKINSCAKFLPKIAL